ncbi:MAG TPA: hypothetical protein VFE96_06495 [Candidatus Bathyarchaeia archaeon]|jgi:hypothetical protein|nr:hypothetical protein [Candidatus Bathyarchaeia archaeon]
MALFGTALALVLTLAVVVPAFGASSMEAAKDRHKVTSPLTKGMTLTITGSGTAFKIGDQDKTQGANLDLKATVEKVSFGRAMLNITGGTLKIGSDTFTVARGHGIINLHSHKMLLHVDLKDASGKHARLVLYGKNAHVPTTFGVGDHFTVDFVKHQSKLAHQWFLNLSATVKRSS